jgi:signal transduction histidine kinase
MPERTNDARLRILLIEDNPGDARLIRDMLARARGMACEPEWVDSLSAGIERLNAEPFDVVLLDLGLPEGRGIATLRRLLSEAPSASTVIVMSGLNDEDVAVEAVHSGAQDYLVKGQVDAALLTRSIRYAIERSQARDALRRAHEELEHRVAERTSELARNVTALKETERRLNESQQLLRQLAARAEAVREEERKALTREIHDEMGQYLSALRLGVSLLELEFGQDNPSLQEKTRKLVALVDSTIKVVRSVVSSLRPAALDMGIVSALEWLAEQFTGRTGVPCCVHVEGDIPLDEQRATELFRIVQESLTNISRHAHATDVDVTLKRNDTHYLVQVRDNGQGFDPAVRKRQSFGLVGIRERALTLGGEAGIASVPGNGTTVSLEFPIINHIGEP